MQFHFIVIRRVLSRYLASNRTHEDSVRYCALLVGEKPLHARGVVMCDPCIDHPGHGYFPNALILRERGLIAGLLIASLLVGTTRYWCVCLMFDFVSGRICRR